MMPGLSHVHSDVVLVEPHLLLSLGAHLLPSTTQNVRTLQFLKSPRHRMHLRSEGAWLLRETPSDPDAWIVIYWPFLTDAFLKDRRIGHNLKALDYSRYMDLRADRTPQLFKAQCRLFQDHFEREVLPPGAKVWGSTNSFLDILSFLPPEAASEGVTVFRAGSLLSARYKTAQARYTSLSPMNFLTGAPLDVIEKLPVPIQLLTAALRGAARGSEDPYTEWGVAWTGKGVVLHLVRAAEALQRHPDTLQCLKIPHVDTFLDAWTSEFNYIRRIPFAGKTKLNEITAHDVDLAVTYTDPYDRCLPSDFMFSQVQRFDPMHTLLFPFKFKSDKLDILKYVKLLKNNRLEELIKESEPEKKTKSLHLPRPKKRKHSRKVSRITFDASSFGYSATDSQRMTIAMIKHGGLLIAIPEEIVELLPPVGDPKWYNRSLHAMGRSPQYVSHTGEKIKVLFPKTKIPESFATYTYEDRVYFNLALLNPEGGEAFQALRALCKSHHNATQSTLDLIKAFRTFCFWLFNPLGDESRYDVVDEFSRLTDPSSDSPVHLLDVNARLDFLWDLGIKTSSTQIAWIADAKFLPKENTRRVYTNVDEYILWYSMTHELPQLEYKLSKKQLSEYLAKRWLWWRTTGAVESKLPEIRTTFMDGNKKPTYDGDMAYLIQKSDEMFGPVMGLQ